MIDTDKYEGHTPAPWRVVKPSHANATGHIWCIESATEIDYSPDHYTRVAHICVIHNEDDDTINAQLIADAPLLLEELKRLREDNKKLHDAINGCAYRGSEGSALDLYCESIIERCPTCYQNIDDMECGCEEE